MVAGRRHVNTKGPSFLGGKRVAESDPLGSDFTFEFTYIFDFDTD
jgi:hypothetical protein